MKESGLIGRMSMELKEGNKSAIVLFGFIVCVGKNGNGIGGAVTFLCVQDGKIPELVRLRIYLFECKFLWG